MEKKVYNAESLAASLALFERKYGLSSSAFYEMTEAGERIDGISGFSRSLWTSLYRDYCRMRDDFTLSVERTLETV